MSRKAQKPARRHHVVSKFYLRGFADESGQITRHPLGPGLAVVPVGIDDATVRKDFYRVEGDGVEPDAFELAMGELESATAPAFEQLIAGHEPLSHQDRYNLSIWIALHFLRSEATRRAGEEIYRAFSKLEVGVFTTGQVRERLGLAVDVPDEEVEELRARMLATADTFPVDHHSHLRLIAESLQGMTNVVFGRQPWIITRYERKALATSDMPVVLIPRQEDRGMGLGTGLGTAAELFVPISRRVGLHLGELPPLDQEPGPPVEVRGTARFARWSNQHTLWNARRIAFHHPADDPLNGLDNRGERDCEMLAPDTDDLIRGFASQQGRPSGLPGHSSPVSAGADVSEGG